MDNIQYPVTGSSGWGTKINNNFKEISDTIGSINKDSDGDIGTQLTNINSQLNDGMKDIFSITRNINGKTIKLIGDSITAGSCGTGFSMDGETIYDEYKVNTNGICWANMLKNYLESNFGCEVNNFGVPGAKSTDVVTHLADLIKTSDDIVICMIGTNNRGITDGNIQLENDIETIYNYVKDLRKEIIFISCIATNLADDSKRKLSMQDIDNSIFKSCSKLNIEYISLYKLFREYIYSNNVNLKDFIASDNIHPNDLGYKVMYNLILEKLGFADRWNYDYEYDTGWMELPLSNSSSVTNYTCQYRRVGKHITFRGIVTGITSFGVFATLPNGFRPSNNIKFLLSSNTDNNLYGKIAILSNGNVAIGYTSATLTSSMGFFLNQISFYID